LRGWIRSVANKKGDFGVGLRKEAALTCEPAVSARDREERENGRSRMMTGLRQFGPRRGGETGRALFTAREGRAADQEEAGKKAGGS
jgi:hypothetical protein